MHWERVALEFLVVVAVALPRALHAQTECTPMVLLENGPSARGSVAVDLRTHYFLIPSRVVSGLTLQPSLAVRWAALDGFGLTLDLQTVDNAGPGRQGRFRASRTLAAAEVGSGNFFQEQTLGGQWRIGDSCTAIVLGGSLSRGTRSYVLRDTATGQVAEGDNQKELVPTLDANIELRSARWRTAVGAAVAFFPADNALYLRRLPDARGGAFGKTFGLSFDGAVLVSNAAIRARVFAPLNGANTIERESGRTVRWPTYQVGLSYAVNPVLATELSLTNALGTGGALALVADREYAALGGGIRFTSGGGSSDRARQSSVREQTQLAAPLRDGPSVTLLDQSFVRALKVSLRGASGGTYYSLGGSPVPDLAISGFLDYVSGTLDEGDLGGLLAVRFVGQSRGAPLSLNVLLAAARSNNVLVNLLAQRSDEFARRGLKKSGFQFGDESVTDGKLYLLTAALPLRRDFANGGHAWGAPTVSAVQREGIELVGVVGGFTWPLTADVHATFDTGVPLGNDGNALEPTSRVRRIPWGASIAWTLRAIPVTFDAFATNRVGNSPFHALRVRAHAETQFGVGMSVAAPQR